ncbi:MucBP domain-containing protein [Enterococcus sp. AZ007]|uniref:MucBP domain-containing protein n=1 Tax=Enterococcus sp. AZ007 TaxID=2774839 RepID=UPI003F21B571
MKRLKLVVLLVLSLCFSVLIASGEEANAADMHRLYNPNSGEHFYTAASGEKNHLVKVGWKYEGIGWTSPENGSAVYRLYNPNAGDHHYTMNVGEKNHLVKVGWKYEGIGWYSDTKKAVPLYRAYNPNAKAGSHNYTVNYAEQQNLLRVGWKNEGIAWYGIKKAVPVTKYTVTVKHVGSDGKLLKSATVNVEKGKSHTAKAESFSGYTIKGSSSQTVVVNGNKTITFNYTKNVTPVTKYTVTVKYVDSAGKEIEKGLTASVEKGKTYKATGKIISGYTLKGNDSQTVTVDGNKTITFTYTKNTAPVTKYTVTVKHIGSDGKELKKTTVLVEKGKAHTEKAETFAGYTLYGKDAQTISAVHADQILTFNYNLNKYNVTVAHKGSNGKTLETEKAVSAEYGKEYTAKAKTFTGYTLSGNSIQKVTVKGATTITFTYNPNKYTVTVVHKGSDGKTLETEKAVSVEYDKEHRANSKTFAGYTLSGNTNQIVTVKGTTTITFIYTKNIVKYKVTVNHKGNDGKNLLTEPAVEVEQGKTHIVNSKAFAGYKLKGSSSQTVTVNKDTTITFNYNSLAFDRMTLHAVVNGEIVKSVTFDIKTGEKFIPSSDKLGLSPDEYDLLYTTYWPEITAVGGGERSYNFNIQPFRNYLSESELLIMQQTIVQKVNDLRKSLGVSPLQENAKLNAAAYVRSTELKKRMAHVRPDGRDISTAITEQGLSIVGYPGENIAYDGRPGSLVSGKAAGEAMFEGWKNSPGHYANMVAPNYKYIGIGGYCYGSQLYGTQLFVEAFR